MFLPGERVLMMCPSEDPLERAENIDRPRPFVVVTGYEKRMRGDGYERVPHVLVESESGHRHWAERSSLKRSVGAMNQARIARQKRIFGASCPNSHPIADSATMTLRQKSER